MVRIGSRCVLAVLVPLLAAFAVLVHHEAAPPGATASAARAMTQAMPMGAATATDAHPEAKAAMGACPSPGSGHCSAPVGDPPTFTAQAPGGADRTHRPVSPGREPMSGPASGLSPPALSASSRLRI
ncbi:hypothetical protein [Streptomyces sp. NPDC048659]|uniref:hypothetical protein n=1 Tax=Streptomyces sp. NPDC048659 TaxID=3155489 RepID=UPI0034424726